MIELVTNWHVECVITVTTCLWKSEMELCVVLYCVVQSGRLCQCCAEPHCHIIIIARGNASVQCPGQANGQMYLHLHPDFILHFAALLWRYLELNYSESIHSQLRIHKEERLVWELKRMRICVTGTQTQPRRGGGIKWWMGSKYHLWNMFCIC